MLFGNNKLYEQTRKIKLGEAELPPILDALKKWVSSRYSINVINIVYNNADPGSSKSRSGINLIVETQSDYSKMFVEAPWFLNESYKKAISERFAKIVKDAGLEKEYDTDDIFVTYDDFLDVEMMGVSHQLLKNHKKHLMSKFSDLKIWDIVQSDYSAMIVVFYNRDDDIIENDKNGNSERIKKECFRLIKQYDEFAYCQFDTFPIAFDSKQNLDENFQGYLFYYFR